MSHKEIRSCSYEYQDINYPLAEVVAISNGVLSLDICGYKYHNIMIENDLTTTQKYIHTRVTHF